jgi:hypothetical protein
MQRGSTPLATPEENCGGKGLEGEEKGVERAGARRDELALRCPVASQPDGPGSWEETNRREAEAQ